MAARAKVMADWVSEGGVLLMGYEMYRLLTLKKSFATGRPKKTKKRSHPVIIDLDEEDRQQEFRRGGQPVPGTLSGVFQGKRNSVCSSPSSGVTRCRRELCCLEPELPVPKVGGTTFWPSEPVDWWSGQATGSEETPLPLLVSLIEQLGEHLRPSLLLVPSGTALGKCLQSPRVADL